VGAVINSSNDMCQNIRGHKAGTRHDMLTSIYMYLKTTVLVEEQCLRFIDFDAPSCNKWSRNRVTDCGTQECPKIVERRIIKKHL
jgi:chromatin remodeling complex protein RSC6